MDLVTDLVLVLGAWGAGSVVVSLAVGAVVARADRRGRVLPGRAGSSGRGPAQPALPSVPAAPLPPALAEAG